MIASDLLSQPNKTHNRMSNRQSSPVPMRAPLCFDRILPWRNTHAGYICYFNRQGAHVILVISLIFFILLTGVLTVQYMYGCQWDDESGQTKGFRQHGYDGEDFLTLDVENKRWIAPVPQALLTAEKWNRVTPLLEAQTQYLTKDCIDWLKKYVQYGHNTPGKRGKVVEVVVK